MADKIAAPAGETTAKSERASALGYDRSDRDDAKYKDVSRASYAELPLFRQQLESLLNEVRVNHSRESEVRLPGDAFIDQLHCLNERF